MKTPALCALLAAGAAAHSLRSGSSALLHPQADAALVGAPDAPLRPDAALVGAPGLPSGVPDVVTVDGGAISGVRAVAANLRYWLGVPYAATTGGDNAWRAPQPRSPWSGTLDASTWGPGCLQPHHNPDCPANQSFDCLNVNVYAPAALPPGTTSLPVMVFIHGGAWLEGSNQGPFYIYAGSYVAANESMVVVTVNYRLSAWGFAALGADATEPVRGNFGLLDQRAALQWVQRNAPAFGGDPTRVTVWGESAGAMSIGIHMGSPGSRGLFSRAIMESNPAGACVGGRAGRVRATRCRISMARCGIGDRLRSHQCPPLLVITCMQASTTRTRPRRPCTAPRSAPTSTARRAGRRRARAT